MTNAPLTRKLAVAAGVYLIAVVAGWCMVAVLIALYWGPL